MLDLQSRARVTYTVPPDDRTLAALARLADLRALPEPDETATAEIAQIEAGLPMTQDVRLTLRAPTAYDMARYEMRRVKVVEWFETMAGRKLADEPDEDANPIRTSAENAVFADAMAWAVIVSTLEGIKVRERRFGSDEAKWIDTDIPPEWGESPDVFLAWAPGELVHEAMATARRLAPTVWGGADPLARKYGGINVAP